MKKAFVYISALTLLFFSSISVAHDPCCDEDIYGYSQDPAILASGVYILLKIDGIDGDSVVDGHGNEIDVRSWGWGMTQSGTMHVGGGGGAGKVSVEDLSLTKYVDRASAGLMRACMSGEHIKEAVLTVRRPGESPIDATVITMENVLVTSVSTVGSAGKGQITENLTLNFGKVKFSYTPQREDGSAAGRIDFTWNIEANVEE